MMNLDEILRTGRSIRKFEQREIPLEVFEHILKNVRLAHCGNNRQVLRYVVVKSDEMRKAFGNLVHYAASLPKEIGEPKEDEKAMAYIVITKPAGTAVVQDLDTGIAAEVICETAWNDGVASCMMMNFSVKEANALLKLGEDRTARLVIALGYPKHHSEVVDVKEDGSVNYYTDEDCNYYVPKRSTKELAEYI